MKVGLLGNMNNAHFALARYLRDRGIDAHLLLFDNELDHFRPESDSYEAGTLDYIHQLDWGSVWRFPVTSSSRIRRDLNPYQFLIGCGAGPAYSRKAGRRLDAFVPFGGDIWTMLGKADGNPVRWAKYVAIRNAQANGIRMSRVVHMAPTNALYETQLTSYASQSSRWRNPVPTVYHPVYRPSTQRSMEAGSPWSERFLEVRSEADLLVFSSARHVWGRRPGNPAAKGTDRLLRGLALFHERHPEVKVRLVTLEYGTDVEKSKRLLQSLGIASVVSWFPKMDRKNLMVGLGLADIACGEFENSWIASGVLYEALVMAKPILAYRDDSTYEEPERYPIMNAREPHEIAACLASYLDDRKTYQAMGDAGRAWYVERAAGQTIDRYVRAIRSKSEASGPS